MATFSPKGRIDAVVVATEIVRLRRLWEGATGESDRLDTLLTPEMISTIAPFDRVQLAFVVETCQASRSLSEAGRRLFAASREKRASTNDADRLRKYLMRFDLAWSDLAAHSA